MAKFAWLRSEDGEVVREGERYCFEVVGGQRRIVIDTSAGHVDLLVKLSAEMDGPWFVLYVLLVSHRGFRAGRYQSPLFEDREALVSFLRSFEAYFENDGRHHVWVARPSGDGCLVYDNHNIIYAYGPLERFQKVLLERGLSEGNVDQSSPHAHRFEAEYDGDEERLMAELDWQWFPLGANDDPQAE